MTPSGIRRWRAKPASSKAKSPAPAAPASATRSSRCQRRLHDESDHDHDGHREGGDLDQAEQELPHGVGQRVTTRPTSVVTPSLVEVATPIRATSTSVAVPHSDEAHDVAGMPEPALTWRLPVEPGRRRDVHGFRDRVGQDAAHVVPSRATAATTRSSSTVPAKRPPKPKISKRPDEVARSVPDRTR